METDIRGLALTGMDVDGVSKYDAMIQALFDYRPNIASYLQPLIDGYPESVMPGVILGYGMASEGRFSTLPRVAIIAADLCERYDTVTRREQMHIDAVSSLAKGNLKQAIEIWDSLLALWPLDLVAFRQMSLNLFWLGQRRRLADLCARLMPAWGKDTPQYGFFIGPLGFALEEIGQYARAEEYAREAVELNPSDMWAVHAVAHVLEMQGRNREGITWLQPKSKQFHQHNAFVGHLWWHLALFHLESGDIDQVLSLFDDQIYPQHSDFYLDIQNAASLLTRLNFLGVNTETQWAQMADAVIKAHGDYLYGFTELHSAIVLARNGEFGRLGQLNDDLEQRLSPSTSKPWLTAQLTRAITEFHSGQSSNAAKRMAPLRYDQLALGGSHAQQDLLLQYQIMAYRQASDLAGMKSALKERLAKRMPLDDMTEFRTRLSEIDKLTLNSDIRQYLQKVSA
ncbi:tetratricopeptide repeat protein [Shewanella corallii]|uniref:Tetratricopeptide repeat protein 38 n=1 Tax=Shewanella corallii TaxID=560080 RepID=A0ABT0N797_9GAMM|nr:tetratricopeptide repeat protein [Shewanella corallii]MCL2914252.1 tetratricopeptide repeat protein [Shewanella corallii]